jgi:hypothetical protein
LHLFHESFGRSDGQSLFRNRLTQRLLLRFVEREHGSGVTGGYPILDQREPGFVRQIEQANHVADGRSVEAQPCSEIFDRTLKSFEIIAKRLGFFENVEILTLQIFVDRDFADRSIIDFEHAARDRFHPRLSRGEQATFTGNQLVSIFEGTDQNRLQHPLLFDRVGEFLQSLRFEFLSRLKRIPFDQIDVNLILLRRVESIRIVRSARRMISKQRAQPSAETFSRGLRLIFGRRFELLFNRWVVELIIVRIVVLLHLIHELRP